MFCGAFGDVEETAAAARIIAASALITEFARDSLLEGAGFEPSVPGDKP